jgi:hypothetical protein
MVTRSTAPRSREHSSEELIVLGSMPIEHVVTMLKATPPDRAVAVLMSMPKDRQAKLMARLDGAIIARMIVVAEPSRQAVLLSYLDDERLSAELTKLPLDRAAHLVASLPHERAAAQLGMLHPEAAAALLNAMPSVQRLRLASNIDPRQAVELRRVAYEKAVTESLMRTAAETAQLPEPSDSTILIRVFRQVFGVAVCYVESGPLVHAAALAAVQAFDAQAVNGLLLVTDAVPTEDAITLMAEMYHNGRPSLVVTWRPDDNDGVLGRALVRLAG